MRIVILGGGFGGLNSALWLGKKLKHTDHEVVVIADKPDFLYRPSLIWVPFNEREITDISFPLAPTLEKVGVEFIEAHVKQVLPKENKVIFQNESKIHYDFLVIATGGFADYEKIQGLTGNTSSIYWAEDALKTKEELENLQSGDTVAIGVAQGNPCQSIAYEFIFELDAFLKKREKNVSLTFFTFEEALSKSAGEKAAELSKKHMEEKGITYHCNVEIEAVDKEKIELNNGLTIPYTFSMILPPYRGADYIFASSGLHHENGMIPVHATLQTEQWENIYAVGDTNRIIDMPHEWKKGRAAEIQAHVAAENIFNNIQGIKKEKKYEENLLGLMELGTDGGMLSVKYPKSKNSSSLMEWSMDGPIPHIMKVALEKYYIRKFS